MFIVCLCVIGNLKMRAQQPTTKSQKVVLIETAQVGSAMREAMRQDVYKQGHDSVTYVDRNSQMRILQVSDKKGNRSYIYQKNQGLVLELRPSAKANGNSRKSFR